MKRFDHLRNRPRAGQALVLGAVLATAGVLQALNANPAASQNAVLTAWRSDKSPGTDPASAVWDDVVPMSVPLSAQLGTYAAGGGSVPSVTAKAVHSNGKIFVRLEWSDATQDTDTSKPELFADAAAIEFPAKSATAVPSICMGQADQGVNIWQWRADSQAGVKDPVETFPNALVDMYPSKDTVFYTARQAGNPFAAADAGAVQTLVSRAFGTLTKSSVQDAQGNGVYANGKWAVVFERSLTGQTDDQANLAPATRTDMAFAVWNGSQGDRNGQKAISQYVTLSVASVAVPGAGGSNLGWYLLGGGLLATFTAVGLGLAFWGARERR